MEHVDAIVRAFIPTCLALGLLAGGCSKESSGGPASDAGDTATGTGEDAGPSSTDESACPDDQVCTQVTEDGGMGCQIDGVFPSDAITGCDKDPAICTGNSACVPANKEQTEYVCSTNCGTCPENQTCSNVTGKGHFGCMIGEVYIPSGAQTGCHTTGCKGNATCFFTDQAKTESVCIENCSPCYPGTCPQGQVCTSGMCLDEPCTEGSCADGEVCIAGSCIPDPGDGPGQNPGVTCNLPPLECEGDEAYCGELIGFDPPNNPGDAGYDPLLGYIDYPVNGETWDNQYRSWARRDVVMMIEYAAAKTACMAGGWEFGNGGPVGLIDMSEENGAIPGTSDGTPQHPAGTHTNGFDIDVAYFQANTPDNDVRPICNHYQDNVDVQHCTDPPNLLDPWRQAMFVGAIFEHPNLRVIGCDGKVGPILMHYIQALCAGGWLTTYACASQLLTYEVTNMGYGWYHSHHHHIHVSYTRPSKRGGPADDPTCLVPGCDPPALEQNVEKTDLVRPLAPVRRLE
ncbi:MAG: hypothetical protein PHU25_02535 [Deltaproteobacteria bacterium]|nr:hypothetical protein [Deltaproteobacteria bacterium]